MSNYLFNMKPNIPTQNKIFFFFYSNQLHKYISSTFIFDESDAALKFYIRQFEKHLVLGKLQLNMQ